MKRLVVTACIGLSLAAALTSSVALLASADPSDRSEPVQEVASREEGGAPELHPVSILRSEVFSDLAGMSRASDLIVIATPVAHERFADHDDVATLTTLQVIDTLKGGASEKITFYSLGLPPEDENYVDIPEVADPPRIGETYVFHLAAFTELTDADGELVTRSDLWRPIQFSQYRADDQDPRHAGSVFVLEDDHHPDAIPRRVTLDELTEAAANP